MILLILFLGLVFRLININQSLWLDEAIGALAVKNFSYTGIVTEFLKADNHPPLYYLVLKFWTGIFGYSEVSLRLPSVVFGILTIYLTYLIAEKIGMVRKFSLLVATLIATSQFHIYYSQEVRMYSMVGFLATLAIYSYLFLLEETKKSLFWIGYSIYIAALMFSDFVPIFLLPFLWIIPLVWKKDRRWWLKFCAAHVPLIILGVFYLPIFSEQIKSGKWLLINFPSWKSVAGGANLKQAILVWTKFVFGRLSLVDKPLYFLLLALASVPVIFSLIKVILTGSKKIFLIWVWFLLPLVTGFLASLFFPAFIYFRFIYVVPAFYILVSWGLLKFKNTILFNVFVILLVLSNVLGITIYYFNENTQRENWKDAVKFVEDRAADEEVVVFEFSDPFAPYQWYSKDNAEAVGVTDSIYADPQKTEEITRNTVTDKRGIYYFEYLRELSDPQDVVRTTIKEQGFRESEIYNFSGVGLIYYYTR